MLKKCTLAIALAFSCASAQAHTSQLVHDPSGQAVFEVRFFNVGDGPFMNNDPKPPSESTWNLNQPLKDGIIEALDRWAEIIKAKPGQLPAVINVGTFEEENAAATSDHFGTQGLTLLQAALTGVAPEYRVFDSHAQIIMGHYNFDETPRAPSQLPESIDKSDLQGTTFHELAHGLGISNSVDQRNPNDEGTPYFTNELGLWAQHLYDDNGNRARPGQNIICAECSNPVDSSAFDVRKDQGYFSGPHVQEVLAGAMPGVPVKMLGEDGTLDNNYMSHTELKASMMSHQSYGNYSGFMEAELAILQDLGYDIDRRNFFGYSIYGSGLQLVNNNGYFLRNDAGTAYVLGQYNTATLGLGLHIYGSNNIVYQQADLLTKGPGGAGVRVDGGGNTLIVQPGTRIHADGLNGRGIMFAYGKGHNLILRGDVQALGEQGIGASFDFGNSGNGNKSGYRGSYINERDFAPVALLPELSGALVDNVDLTGRLAGKSAAIYISRNALVGNINVMRGAQIQGNIYSAYNQKDDLGQQRLTQLTFGRLADGLGRSTSQADTGFVYRYDGNIQGADNLVVNTKGGLTSLNGTHELYGVLVDPGSTLGGNSTYTLNTAGSFLNHGTFAPGNSIGTIVINGDYKQGADGNLLMELDADGAHDTLIVNGNVDLKGSLSLEPMADWYASGTTLRLDNLLQASTVTGAFDSVNSLLSSPTLSVQAAALGGNSYQLRFTRKSQAYSQYARSANASQAGLALDNLAAAARPDIQPLYQALDFSAPDGGSIARALDRISPQAYSAMVASSLTREHQVADIITARSISSAHSRPLSGEWRGFATPFGGGFRQDAQGSIIGYNSSSYGVVFGAEHSSARSPNWTLGVYGAVSGQSVSVNDSQNASGRSTAFNLGLQARYAPDPSAGLYAFGQGQFGIEDGKLTRRLGIESYSASQRSDWTALSGSLIAGGGYRWALSPTLSLGPLAMLNYTRLNRPGTTESGNDAGRLALSSSHFDSLRSSIGANASLNLPQSNGALLTANLQLTWDRELLNNDYVQDASFAGYPGVRFSNRNKVAGRDALGLGAGLSYEMGKNLTISANISSQLFGAGYSSVSGSVSLARRF